MTESVKPHSQDNSQTNSQGNSQANSQEIQNPTTETLVLVEEQLPEAPKSQDSVFTSFMPLILIFTVFYFLLIRPQEQKKKEQEDLVNSVKKGEEVVTHSGLFGKVTKVDEISQTVELEIADKVHVKMMKSGIMNVLGRDEKSDKADKKSAKKAK